MCTVSAIWPPVQSPEHAPSTSPSRVSGPGSSHHGRSGSSWHAVGSNCRHESVVAPLPHLSDGGIPKPGPALIRGMGFMAQADPLGDVPSVTYTPLDDQRPGG